MQGLAASGYADACGQVPGVALLSGRFRRAASDKDLAGASGNACRGRGCRRATADGTR
jgi:hypothetical protein